VIIFSVHLDQFRVEIGADLGEDRSQMSDGIAIERFAAVFGDKDQMNMHLEYAVSSVPNIVVIYHRPSYTIIMQRLQAFKYELMPDSQQERQMRRFAGACRFVFNKALALQKVRYEQGEKKLGYAGLCKLLTEWRNGPETQWLADAPVHPLQQTLKDLERAYTNFFAKRAAFPRIRKKGQRDSFRYPDPKQIRLDQANGRISLPKLGWLRYRNSRVRDSQVPSSSQRCNDHECESAQVPPASEPRNILVLAVPASQRILGGISQLANGRVKPLAKPDIEFNCSKSVCIGIHELPPGGPSFRPHPLYLPNRLSSAWKPTGTTLFSFSNGSPASLNRA